LAQSIYDNKGFTGNNDIMAKFVRDLEQDALSSHSDQERVQMLKVIKRELRRYSYLTMSKNVCTADQIIKTIEINGGKFNADNYTVSRERELLRKTKYVRILMNLFKELEFEDWHSITVESLSEWIKKLSSLTLKQLKRHKVFRPADLDKELKEIEFR
jgi:hypothetical protein